MKTRGMATLVVLAGFACGAGKAGAEGPQYEKRWFYAMFNLQVKERADELIGLMKRAKAAGYNGVVLADYKLSILDRVSEQYFVNAARVRKEAEAIGIEIIPAVFPIGYSNGLLAHDPNLAEGMLVENAPFVVKGDRAEAEKAAEPLYRNGGFEEAKGDRFAGFSFQDDPGSGSYADGEVKREGTVSLRLEGKGESPNRRIMQGVEVRPKTCYRFTAWVKTEGLAPVGSFRLLALAAKGGRSLTFYEGGLERTGDWRRVEVVFNSLDQEKVNLYVGIWGSFEGKVWVDDVRLEELSLVNVLRRAGCPLTVAAAETGAVYEEGRDFEPVVDAKLGNVPYAGEYETDHEGASIRLKAGTRMREGERLLVSWYHPVVVHGSQVMCCPSEPKVVDLLRDQARRVEALFEPRTYFMSHDEIRVMNWDRACLDRGLTPGQMLAENARTCVEILDEVSPGAEVYVWSDMFDPFHNAVKDYYLVNGTLEGSWEGLAARVGISNWNGGKMRESLEFFAKRGHAQVAAGYYDASDLSNFERWDRAGAGVVGFEGFMYTTWEHRFELLEAHGRAMLSRD